MYPDLIKQLSATMGKKKVDKLGLLLAEKDFALSDLVDLTFHADKGIAFRSAWLLENMLLRYPEIILPYISYIVSRIKEVQNASCKRHYAKIMMHLTSPRAPLAIRQAINEIDLEPAIEQCFDWLIDPHVLVAVKSFASEALFNMRVRYPWIVEELPEQLEYLMRDGTAAIQSKGRRLLSYFEPH